MPAKPTICEAVFTQFASLPSSCCNRFEFRASVYLMTRRVKLHLPSSPNVAQSGHSYIVTPSFESWNRFFWGSVGRLEIFADDHRRLTPFFQSTSGGAGSRVGRSVGTRSILRLLEWKACTFDSITYYCMRPRSVDQVTTALSARTQTGTIGGPSGSDPSRRRRTDRSSTA